MYKLLKGLIATAVITSTATMLSVGAASASAVPASGYHEMSIGYDNLCVDEYGDNSTAGAAIDQYSCNQGPNQAFQLVPMSNGYFELQVENSGQDVMVANGSKSVGGVVVQEPANGSSASLWQPLQQSDGSWEFQNQNSGMCLDVYGGGANVAQQLDQWWCKNATGTNQDFGWVAPPSAIPPGFHQLLVDNDTLCVDVYHNRAALGDPIDQWTCNFHSNQQFEFVPMYNGYGELQTGNSGQDITVASDSTSAGALIIQEPPNGDPSSLWRPTQEPDGTWQFQNNRSGMCLDVYGGGGTLGQQLDQWWCKNASGTNQDFGVGAAAGIVSCANPTSYQDFSQFGDSNYYFQAPGGDFHTYDWHPWVVQGGASFVSGGDPWNVSQNSNPNAAMLPAGGSVSSWPLCVNSSETAVRFFYNSPGVSGSTLQVDVGLSTDTGTVDTTSFISGGSRGWAASPIIALPNMYNNSGEETITITLTSTGTAATWEVAEAMIDPFCAR